MSPAGRSLQRVAGRVRGGPGLGLGWGMGLGAAAPTGPDSAKGTRSVQGRAALCRVESVPDVASVDRPTGSTMLLRETSLLPHVPGLPALLSALFAPVIELRFVRPSVQPV